MPAWVEWVITILRLILRILESLPHDCDGQSSSKTARVLVDTLMPSPQKGANRNA